MSNFIFFQSNSVYGKTMQNVRQYINVKLHTNSSTALKAVADPNFKHYSIIDEDLVQTNHFQPVIKHVTPIAIGVTILELVRKYILKYLPVAQLASAQYKLC